MPEAGGPALCRVVPRAAFTSQIFGVSEAELLSPAPRRQLLAALLGELRDAHWAAAAGCDASPATMTQLTPRTAIDNKVRPGPAAEGHLRGATARHLWLIPHLHPHQVAVPVTGVRAAALRRALAAAEKRLWLLPDDK